MEVRGKRRVWMGGDKHRPFQVVAKRRSGPDVPPQNARFVQQASWPKWVMPTMFALLAIGIAAAAITVPRALRTADLSKPVAVPTVTEREEADAKDSLKGKGFEVMVRRVYDGGRPNVVISQDPPAGDRKPRGTTVQIVVTTQQTVPKRQRGSVEGGQGPAREHEPHHEGARLRDDHR